MRILATILIIAAFSQGCRTIEPQGPVQEHKAGCVIFDTVDVARADLLPDEDILKDGVWRGQMFSDGVLRERVMPNFDYEICPDGLLDSITVHDFTEKTVNHWRRDSTVLVKRYVVHDTLRIIKTEVVGPDGRRPERHFAVAIALMVLLLAGFIVLRGKL